MMINGKILLTSKTKRSPHLVSRTIAKSLSYPKRQN
jgi:hypothetical protein